MFEFDKYESQNSGARSQPDESYEHFQRGYKRALLLWGEHCVECAAPDCYATCDLYIARPDERCRRFEYGIYRNKHFTSAAGYGAEVIFRRWGKLEARGNATLLPWRLSYFLENVIYILLPPLNLIGRFVRRLGASIRWSYISFGVMERLNRWLLKKRSTLSRPDAFVSEIYNPANDSFALRFSIAIDCSQLMENFIADQLPRPFSTRLSIKPGYNRIDTPASEFMEILESGLPFNMTLTPESDEGTQLVFLNLDLVQFREEDRDKEIHGGSWLEKKSQLPAAKCVVFDLDNTLWDGILLEGNINPRPRIAEIFAELDLRGILISIASKNSYSDAIVKLTELGLEEYLLYPMINWDQKSKNVKKISEKISIGIDTILFVDDNPFEREEVAKIHPEVEVLPDTALESLLEHPRLQGSKTAESAQRRAMYQQEIQREEVAISFGNDYMTFLKDCEIVVNIFPITPEYLERVIELVQRTNQLNFSGRKYGREEIIEIINGNAVSKHVIACRDKFGSYGVVGFALTQSIDSGVRIEDFMLSCRVQGKFIEQAFFEYLVNMAQPPANVLEINFLRTDRNELAQGVLQKLGFSFEQDGVVRLDVNPDSLRVDFLTVHVFDEGRVASHASSSGLRAERTA